MNRRGLLGAMLAACTAPAFVRAGSLMTLAPRQVFSPDVHVMYTKWLSREDYFFSFTESTIDVWDASVINITKPPRYIQRV